MPNELDVYRDWLGIKETERPLNNYQLLRLSKFEDDAAKIRAHYRKINSHVRKYASGDYATQSQELLNELARAMLCLTDMRRKAEYDATLGRKDDGTKRRRTLEELLVGRKVVDSEQLAKARDYANAVGLEVRDALLQQKLAKPEVVMQIYAESEGLPYIELADIGIDEQLVPKVPVLIARQHSCIPVMVDDGQLLMASPNPLVHEVEDELRLRTDMPIRTVLCTVSGVNAVIAEHYPKSAAVAEMAAGTAGGSSAAAKAGAPEDPQAAADKKKQRRLVTIMCFNFSFMGLMLYQVMLKSPPATLFTALGISMVVAGVVAATAYVGQQMTGR